MGKKDDFKKLIYLDKCCSCKREFNWENTLYVGMGNHECIECFVKSSPTQCDKIAKVLPKIRARKWKCEKCLKTYKSDWNFQGICDACKGEGWEYSDMMDIGWAVVRYVKVEDKWPKIIGYDPKKKKEYWIRK